MIGIGLSQLLVGSANRNYSGAYFMSHTTSENLPAIRHQNWVVWECFLVPESAEKLMRKECLGR